MLHGQLSPWDPREGPSCLPQLLVLPEILDVPWFIAKHSDSCPQLHTADCPACLYGPPHKRTDMLGTHHLTVLQLHLTPSKEAWRINQVTQEVLW